MVGRSEMHQPAVQEQGRRHRPISSIQVARGMKSTGHMVGTPGWYISHNRSVGLQEGTTTANKRWHGDGCQHALSRPLTESMEKQGSDLCFTAAGIQFLFYCCKLPALHQSAAWKAKEGGKSFVGSSDTKASFALASLTHMSKTGCKERLRLCQAAIGLICISYATDPEKPPKALFSDTSPFKMPGETQMCPSHHSASPGVFISSGWNTTWIRAEMKAKLPI